MPEPNTASGQQRQLPVAPKRKIFFSALLTFLGMIVGGTLGGAVGYALDDSPAPIPYWGFPFNPYGLKAGLGSWAGITLGGIAGAIVGVVVKRKSR